jgi:hypothetical protein
LVEGPFDRAALRGDHDQQRTEQRAEQQIPAEFPHGIPIPFPLLTVLAPHRPYPWAASVRRRRALTLVTIGRGS